MKRTKALLILFLILCIITVPFQYVRAYSGEYNKNIKISSDVINPGKGHITVDESQTGDIYYQCVELPENAIATEIGRDYELDTIWEEKDKLQEECDNLKTIQDEAYDTWQKKIEDGATEAEIATAKEAYETAKSNLEKKQEEFNAKETEFYAKIEQENQEMEELIPDFVEDKWIKTEDGSYDCQIDTTTYAGYKLFAIWAKLVDAEGNVSYNASGYEDSFYVKGDLPVVDATSITLNKTSLNLEAGSEETLTATIEPTNATYKIAAWASDNDKVAKVKNGKIIAVSEGTTTIRAIAVESDLDATCTVTVTKKAGTPNEDGQDDKNNNDNQGNQDNKDDKGNKGEQKDPTVADTKIPQTGSLLYIAGVAIIALGITGIVAYKKGKHLNFK